MSVSWKLLVVSVALLLSLLKSTLAQRREKSGCDRNKLTVHITISTFKRRNLELHWDDVKFVKGDWIGLFRSDPRILLTSPLDRAEVSGSRGSYVTSVDLPYYYFGDPTRSDSVPLTKLMETCLDFWVAYIRGRLVLAAQCLATHPQWMWDLRKYIGNYRLHEILLPGTHGSGSFRKSKDISFYDTFIVTQDENIWSQLIYGIRYFDFRIGYYSSSVNEPFWFNHNFVWLNPLSTGIAQIKAFIQATREIIILDLHRFPVGFDESNKRHRQLIAYLVKELGQYMIPRDQKVTINQLWESNKRILVAYGSPIFKENRLLWKSIPQVWAETDDIKKLRKYLERFMEKPKRQMWASMAALTPTKLKVVFSDLAKMADKVNPQLTVWFRENWWQIANAVATDFFLGNNMIEVAIEANKRRMLCRDVI